MFRRLSTEPGAIRRPNPTPGRGLWGGGPLLGPPTCPKFFIFFRARVLIFGRYSERGLRDIFLGDCPLFSVASFQRQQKRPAGDRGPFKLSVVTCAHPLRPQSCAVQSYSSRAQEPIDRGATAVVTIRHSAPICFRRALRDISQADRNAALPFPCSRVY